MTTEIDIPDADVIEEPHGVALERRPPAQPLFQTDDPVEVIAKATRVADALKSVVKSRGLISTIQGREHPRVEAWQTLGSMLGVYPVKDWVRQIPWPDPIPDSMKSFHARGLAFGFEASFSAVRADGAVLGSGEAACMRSEKTWSTRDDYAIRSMAQTRATSKALKAPLGFVMSLAGYETTPAEEMPPTAATTQQPEQPLVERATPGDVDEMKAALKGLNNAKIRLVFGAVGLDATSVSLEQVPRAKVPDLIKKAGETAR